MKEKAVSKVRNIRQEKQSLLESLTEDKRKNIIYNRQQESVV